MIAVEIDTIIYLTKCLLGLLSVVLFSKLWTFYSKIWAIPTIQPCYPIVGSIPEIVRRLLFQTDKYPDILQASMSFLNDATWKCPARESDKKIGVWKVWIGPFPFIFVTRPEPVQALLGNKEVKLPKSRWPLMALDNHGEKGMEFSNGDVWKMHRKVLTPKFRGKELSKAMPLVNDVISKIMKDLRNQFESSPEIPDIQTIARRVIAKSGNKYLVDGITIVEKTLTDEDYDYLDDIFDEYSWIAIQRLIFPWLLFRPIFELTSLGKRLDYIKDEILLPWTYGTEPVTKIKEGIAKGQVQLDEEEKEGNECMLAYLFRKHMENPTVYTEKDVLDELYTLAVAGATNPQSALTWLFILLGNHKEVQEKVIQEVDDIFGSDDNNDLEITREDTKRMTYTDAVFKETLRMANPASAISPRKAEKDIVVPLGAKGLGTVTIPKHAIVVFHIFGIHRCKDYWPDAETFNPERFLSNEKQHPFAFLGFSGGERSCPGKNFSIMQAKAMVAAFFRTFTIKECTPISDIKCTHRFSYKPVSPVRMTLQLREKKKKGDVDENNN